MNKLLYNKNFLVAKINELNHIEWICKERAPLYLQKTGNFIGWLQNRCVDSHRKNSRLLKKALRISEKDDEEIVLEVNAATITDTYWVKDESSPLTWEEVEFKKSEFASLALIGTYNDYYRAESAKTRKTPELTNTGSFEKCWKVRNGSWWLYKAGNQYELFSELFVYKLGKVLGFNMAEYTLGSKYIQPRTRYLLSKDFTQNHKYNFEPIAAIAADETQDYKLTYQKIYDISPNAANDYVSLLFMDALVYNPDRHEYNFGLLTDPDTGAIIGLAPNFDNNMSLISRGYPRKAKSYIDYLISDFNDLLDSGVEWKGYSEYKVLPMVTEETIRSTIKGIGMKVKENFIVEFIMSRYKAIGWDKSMTIEMILKTVHSKNYTKLLDDRGGNENKALQLITEDVFYIPPTIEVLHEDDNPQVMIFSAAGATGKSALAKYLAKNFKCIYWNLAKTSVGENSFYGKLDKILGRKNVDDFQVQMMNGTTALIIDAFDEAEIRRGRSDIKLFLDDVINFVGGFKKPTMILLSRSENARFLNEYLTEHDVSVVHYQIGLIDEENGKKFIRESLKRKQVGITPIIEQAIDQEFINIEGFLGVNARAFLGYAPVLEALTELVYQAKNTINLLQDLKKGDNSDTVFKKIMWGLLVREQQKFTEQIKAEWQNKYPNFCSWEKIYTINEQIYDILNYTCFSELVEQGFSNCIPDELRKDYENSVMSFLPSHPFIHQKENGEFDFSGPAFRDFSIVYGLLSNSDTVKEMAKDVLERQSKTSPLLAEFYNALNDSEEIPGEKITDKKIFPYIYDSCKAANKNKESTKLTINGSDNSCYAVISTRAGENGSRTLYFEIDTGDPKGPLLILPSLENAFISFPGKVIIQGISNKNVPSEISLKNTYIDANIVEFRTDKILFIPQENSKIQIIAHEQLIVQPNVTITGAKANENKVLLYSPDLKKDYRLRQYYFDISSSETVDLSTFSHYIRTICLQFNFGKSRTTSIMEKLFLRDPDSDKYKIFRFLQDKECVKPDGSDYTVNLPKMSALNISWQATAQHDTTMYEDAYAKYCDWLKEKIKNSD